MKYLIRTVLAAVLLMPALAHAGQSVDRKMENLDFSHGNPKGLAALVRAATEQFRDVEYAMAMGYQPGPCVSGRDGGAMGVHFANFGYVLDGLPPDVNAPEILIYEPLRNGRYRLAGVEFLTLIDGEPTGTC